MSLTVGASQSDQLHDISAAVAQLCDRFPGAYLRGLEPDRYPHDFVSALTSQGWLAILIPDQYGGGGLGIRAASVVLEEINAQGGNAAACHAQMYTMGTLVRHGSESQKARWLPQIASGTVRLQAFGVTEPNASSDITAITTTAERVAAGWRIRGQKAFTSRAQHSDLMLLLARTTPLEKVTHRPGVERFGRIDLHHLNAGIVGTFDRIPDISVEDFDKVIGVNLRGTSLGIRSAFRQYAAQGRIDRADGVDRQPAW